MTNEIFKQCSKAQSASGYTRRSSQSPVSTALLAQDPSMTLSPLAP